MPAPLVDPSLDAVFGNVEAVDLVFGRDQNLWLIAFRDTGSGEFLGTLTSIEDGQGYWVRASYFVSVTLDLLEVTELPSYEVGPGWTPTRTLLPRPLFPGTSGNTKSSLQGLWQTMYTFEHEQSGPFQAHRNYSFARSRTRKWSSPFRSTVTSNEPVTVLGAELDEDDVTHLMSACDDIRFTVTIPFISLGVCLIDRWGS